MARYVQSGHIRSRSAAVGGERFGVHGAVERARSGNGAHVWFFFSAPVPAAVARRLGPYLLPETMARRHQLPLSSYDRLFPNQDTMPQGGFGNLIALPLQPRASTRPEARRIQETSSPRWIACS